MKIYPEDSLYRGDRIFDREQLVFFAETILLSALDLLESGLPTSISWEEREERADTGRSYELGIIEQAGMSLSVLYAQLTGDGIGVYDALACAADFDEAINDCFSKSWEDCGEKVKQAINAVPEMGGFNVQDVIPSYPDVRKHAEAFVNYILETTNY
jgi:hypothetical protein